MSNDFLTVTISGLKSLRDLRDIGKKSELNAQRAINKVARDARSKSGKRLRAQIAFGARYLTGQDGKIEIAQASKGHLQATLSASSNPRSLARFVVSRSKRRGSIKVQVQPGGIRPLKGAFLLNLNGGEGGSLLAVRSPTKPPSAYRPRKLGKSIWLLYGPSVSQALISHNERKGIWVDMETEIAVALETEYLRLMKVEGI